MIWIALLLGSFVSGSIPFGLLIAKRRGVDIRCHGSGNIGATNVGRVLGRRAGLTCFLLDFLKGLAPALVAGAATGLFAGRSIAPLLAGLWFGVAACAVLGHMYTPWARFKGGKGVATGLGALLGIFPWLSGPVIAAALVWLVMVRIWKYVGIASCVAAFTIPIVLPIWVQVLGAAEISEYWPFLVGSAVLAAVVVIKHRGNIRRTINGTEPKIGQRAPSE